MEFDFQRYIQERTSGGDYENAAPMYAFGRDHKVMRTLELAKPVKLALEASARLSRERLAEMTSQAALVDAQSEPRLHRLLLESCKTLQMAAPAFYTRSPMPEAPAMALSDGENTLIFAAQELAEEVGDAALRFLLGRQCGHIQQGHVVYLDAIFALAHQREAFLGWIVTPAAVALRAWARLGRITADRAGLMACGDPRAAVATLIKFSLEKTVDAAEVERIWEQASNEVPTGGVLDGASNDGTELPLRLRALALFAESEVYRETWGSGGGESLTSVDRQVSSVVKLW